MKWSEVDCDDSGGEVNGGGRGSENVVGWSGGEIDGGGCGSEIDGGGSGGEVDRGFFLMKRGYLTFLFIALSMK